MSNFLTGGQQTTVNSTITELFPALCFNNGYNPKSPKDLKDYINKLDLTTQKSKKSFVNANNLKAGKEFIILKDRIRPVMLDEKIQNAYAITQYLFDVDKKRKIDKVIWGYREKPAGVPNNHAGDIFIYFKDTTKYPSIIGVSLKAGTEKTSEPKLNSYVRATLTKPMWKKAYPRAIEELKEELWKDVYSKIPSLPKEVNKQNYISFVGVKDTTKANPILIEKMIDFFEHDPKSFDNLYFKMNLLCRQKMCDAINKNFVATKEWIGTEFRLEKKGEDVPLILVKAIKSKYQLSGDPLADMLPTIKTIKARLDKNSVQEWFIDVSDGKKTLTLLMTIRSDSEFRRAKPKGKLGSFVGLKLLYRGIKK